MTCNSSDAAVDVAPALNLEQGALQPVIVRSNYMHLRNSANHAAADAGDDHPNRAIYAPNGSVQEVAARLDRSALLDLLRAQEEQLCRYEDELVVAQERLRFFDEAFPGMLAYVDSSEIFSYHNRAYRDWLGLAADAIDGKTMREVLGEAVYAEIAAQVRDALSGRPQRYERTQKAENGGIADYFVYLIPHRRDSGEVCGLYTFVVDETPRRTVADAGAARAGVSADGSVVVADAGDEIQDLYDDSLEDELSTWHDTGDRIRSAIAKDEFRLYGQRIIPLLDDVRELCEVYIRLLEEERNLMPPGAFLPLAEQYHLMPEIDRWVVASVIKRVASEVARTNPAYCINLAADTVRDPYFPDFVRTRLDAAGAPGDRLVFEIDERDACADPADAARLVQELARLGCASTLSGFGRDRVSFAILKDLRVAYLKIDSSIVLQVDRDRSALAKLNAINRVAQTVGIKTIAEFVESDAMVSRLRVLRIDYAQGSGISPPCAME